MLFHMSFPCIVTALFSLTVISRAICARCAALVKIAGIALIGFVLLMLSRMFAVLGRFPYDVPMPSCSFDLQGN